MSDKINVIARKIYEEGLEKAQEESLAILENARKEAGQILNDAKNEAEQILKKAESQSIKTKKIIDSEMKLASEQVLETLRQKIKNLVSSKLLDKGMKDSFGDPAFIKELVLELSKNWTNESNIEINLSKGLGEKIETALKSSLKATIKNSEISISPKLKSGFVIIDKDDQFEISFTEDQFREMLKPFIKEKTQQLIFTSL
jgi:V/A-type H+/Na+-transporting ATPase subunit E